MTMNLMSMAEILFVSEESEEADAEDDHEEL